MKKHPYLILTIVAALVIVLICGFLIYRASIKTYLTAEQLKQKFECNRVTHDVRATDVFCGDPKFYTNPDSVTVEDYSNFINCSDRLSGQPPSESIKITDSAYYQAYYDCKDRSKLESLRQSFVEQLKKTKAAVDSGQL